MNVREDSGTGGGGQIERAAWNASFEAALGDGKEAVGVSPGETSRGSGDRIVLAVLVLLVVLILLILLIRPLRNVVSTFFRFCPAGPRETESTATRHGTGGRRTGEESAGWAVSAPSILETLKADTAELLMQDMEQGANVLKVWLKERDPEAAEKHPGVRKAAILLLALGERHAADIFAHLEHWEIARVSRVIMEMEPVSRAMIEGVLREFSSLLATGDSTLMGGPERVRRLLRGVKKETAGYVLEALELETGQGPLKSMEKVRPGVLAEILRDEHPQTLALILGHLDSEQAAGLLQRLAPSVRADVLVRLARLESVSEDVLREVDKVLEGRILAVSGKKGRKAGGPGAAAAILDALDRDMEKEILTEIEGLSAQLAAEIRQGTGK